MFRTAPTMLAALLVALLASLAAAPTPPSAPMGLGAVATSPTTVSLSWATAHGQAAYAIDRATRTVPWVTVATPPATATTYTDTGLTSSTTYAYRVRATNPAGSSVASNYAGVTTPAAPPIVVPAVGTTLPTTAPTTAPATAGGIACGSPGTLTTAYIAGQVPKVVVLDITGQCNVLTDNVAWDLPGSTIANDPKTGVPVTGAAGHVTSLVAAEYDTPGTYTATATVTHANGSTSVYAASVTLTADARPEIDWDPVNGNDANAGSSPAAAWQSAEKVRAAIAKSAAHVRLLSNATLPTPAAGQPGYFNPASETVIEGVPDAEGTVPTITVGPFTGLFVSGGRTGILTRDLTITSIGTPQPNGNVMGAAQAKPYTNRSIWVQSFAADCSVVRCNALCLVQGFQQFQGDLAVIDCGFPTGNTVSGQGILATGINGRLIEQCVSGRTFSEAISRTDGNISRFGVSHCYFRQNPPSWLPLAPKPGFDGRSGGGVVADCYFWDCPLSFSQSIASTATVPGSITGNIRVRRNTFYADQPLIYTTWVDIKAPAFNVTLDGNTYSKSVPAFVTASGSPPPANIVQSDNAPN